MRSFSSRGDDYGNCACNLLHAMHMLLSLSYDSKGLGMKKVPGSIPSQRFSSGQ